MTNLTPEKVVSSGSAQDSRRFVGCVPFFDAPFSRSPLHSLLGEGGLVDMLRSCDRQIIPTLGLAGQGFQIRKPNRVLFGAVCEGTGDVD